MLTGWLKDLIAIPSPSGGEADLAAYLAGWARQRGLECHEDAGNVYVRLPGRDAAKAMILHAHMDVVPPGDPARWTTPPFAPDERDGRICGSGASDDKAGIACAMAVAAGFAEEAPPVDLWLVWVVCEETDGSGSIAFARWFAERWQGRYREVGGVLFEATECRWLEYDTKGSVFLRVTTEGGCGHAAMRPDATGSAIAAMAQAVPRFGELERSWHQAGFDQATALVTAVRAGDLEAPNRLDSACEFAVDMRTTAGMHERVLPEVASLLADLPHRLDVVGDCPPGFTPPDAPLIQAFEQVLPGVEKRQSVASNDLFAFSAIGVPAFVFGPGAKEAIHRPDEYVEVAALERSVAIIRSFVLGMGEISSSPL
ncbi:MAG: M20 family metallopeptidase [Candidatus Sericytochromatia bacterium]